MSAPYIPFWVKVAAIAAVVVLTTIWAAVWTAFVRSLPMWLIYAANVAFWGWLAIVCVQVWWSTRRDHARGDATVQNVAEVEYLPPLPRPGGQRGGVRQT